MTESLKRSYSSIETEEESGEESELVSLAPPPPPAKRQRVEEVEVEGKYRIAMIKELKTLRINHPNLKIGLTAQLDAEFNGMSMEELHTLRDNYHLELTGAQPFATGRAAATVLGNLLEGALKVPGFHDTLLADSHFVANLDQALPISMAHYGPQLQAGLSLGTHVINALSSWQVPTTQPPRFDPPAASSS